MATTLDDSIGLLHLFGDATRVRLLSLLERHELTVAELTAVTELTQSRVSTHLGRLRDAGMLKDRKAGAATYYRAAADAMPVRARELWRHLSAQLRDEALEDDAARALALLRARSNGGTWPDSVAGQMERHYSPGRTWESLARGFLGLMRLGRVLDVGCGDGTIAELISARADAITCVDRSEKLLSAARRRLGHSGHVCFCRADMHALPFGEGTFDDVLLFNVLTYATSPSQVIAEAARVLGPGGRLTLVTLRSHRHTERTEAYGHVHAGFKIPALRRLLRQHGFGVQQCAVTSRERRKPRFEVISAFAVRGDESTANAKARPRKQRRRRSGA